MTAAPDLTLILHFLAGLRQNNHKAWFEEHRSEYDAARQRFEDFLEIIIDEFRLSDGLGGLQARQCTPRIYRDVRFSKDKSPYKTNFGALIGPQGWKSTWRGYYLSLEPGDHSLVAGGLYLPEPAQLERFRQAIDQHPGEFLQAVSGPDFVRLFGKVSGERLKTAPKGYDKAHPHLDLLQLKQITALRPVRDAEALDPGFAGQVIDACRALRPFLDFVATIA